MFSKFIESSGTVTPVKEAPTSAPQLPRGRLAMRARLSAGMAEVAIECHGFAVSFTVAGRSAAILMTVLRIAPYSTSMLLAMADADAATSLTVLLL